MKTFSQFISEAISTKAPRRGSHYFSQLHHDNIDGTQVEVDIGGYGGHHDVSYKINGNWRRMGKVKPQTRRKILNFVHSRIVNHIKKNKPKSLRMAGDTGRKTKFYQKYAKRLNADLNNKYEVKTVPTLFSPNDDIPHLVRKKK